MLESKNMAFVYKVQDGKIVPCEPIEVGLPNELTNFDLTSKSSIDFTFTETVESKELEEFLKSRVQDPELIEGQKVLVRTYDIDADGDPVTKDRFGYATQNEEGDLCLTFY